ncbi:hypothetical protein TNCV_710161 [Trichonephila clavipes]|nr:hypothetical protein TNCV_710161 [Trichonephila clavipes]
MVGSSGHEKVPTREKSGLERPGRPRGERMEGIERQALMVATVTRAVFQQDNARPHTARVAQDFLRQNQTKNRIPGIKFFGGQCPPLAVMPLRK